jgi:signal transduction histidine kinase
VGVLARSLISQIQTEIDDRMEIVSDLEQRARTTQQLYDLNREQVEAIATVLQGEINRGETRALWIRETGSGFFFSGIWCRVVPGPAW